MLQKQKKEIKMSQSKQIQIADADGNGLYRIGGMATLILIVYSLVTMMLLILVGGQPSTAEEIFTLLQNNRVVGLLRLDVLTIIVMPLYYLLFASIYVALRRTNGTYAALATALAFIGITLFLATPSVSSMVYLSDQYAAATTETQKSLFLAAGESTIASDMWHGTGAIMGGILLQSAWVLISVVMRQSKVFGQVTAHVGILTHGLDLAHFLIGFFVPGANIILMAIAGPLYLIWFPLIGRDLFRLSRGTSNKA
ncbi:MAG: hypothetical protein GY832_19745 [Chloroflexi bacterium]|nr:hypothetical protein [Chloroflexota bacterium]